MMSASAWSSFLTTAGTELLDKMFRSPSVPGCGDRRIGQVIGAAAQDFLLLLFAQALGPLVGRRLPHRCFEVSAQLPDPL